MNSRFATYISELDAKWQELKKMPPVIAEEIPRQTPMGGIYLFSEGGKNLYAGRTKRRISERVRNHFTGRDCPFAFLLARVATGRTTATYTQEGSRKALMKNRKFKKAYEDARKRIRKMKIRYVCEPHPVKNALLEIYVATAARASHNSFRPH